MQVMKRAGKPDRYRRRGTARPARSRIAWQGQGDFLAAAVYLVLVGLFGGGLATWNATYALLAAVTIVLAVLLGWRDGFRFAGIPRTARSGLLGIAAVPLLQLIPLPPSIWQALPGQALRRGTLEVAGMADTWQPLSLDPSSTALCAILAIGFVALVGFLLRLTDQQFRRMLQVGVALVVVGIAIGLAQVVSDGYPQIQVTNMGSTMIGLFANKNHMAAVIACSIVMVGLVVGRDLLGRDKRRPVIIGYLMLGLVCIVTTNSRAGLVLGGIAAAIVLADLARGVALRWRITALAGLVLLLLVILSSSAFQQVSGRVGEVDTDLRWAFTIWSWPLAEQYWLLGSGIGAFATLFIAHEQLAWLMPTTVNAVHNDYLQLVIEAGLPGILVLLALLAAVVRCTVAGLALRPRDPRRAELFAGLAVLLLFALHSVVDYPLRRPAAWIFLALALAAVFRRWRDPDTAAVRADAA